MSEANIINFYWLLRLRWGAILGQIVVIAVVVWGMEIALPLGTLAAIIAVESAFNLGCFFWASAGHDVQQEVLAALLAADVVFLTLLLSLTGGPFNPFSFWYAVHIALGAVLLRPSLTWSLAAFALAGFGLLFLLASGADASHHAEHFRLHIQGMWFAFGIAAMFIVYFIQRVTRALAESETALHSAREHTARSEKLASLATLAAGAAHELATPLSTIAVIATEMERQIAGGGESFGDDVRLIRQQVNRCREILADMSADAGESAGEGSSEIALGELLAELRCGDVTLEVDATAGTVQAPPRALLRALRGLVRNAVHANNGTLPVTVHVGRSGNVLSIEIRDHGAGMSAEVLARAGEPFFTTRPPGQGMGLGIFLARALFQRLGGSLHIRSTLGVGTTVEVSLPSVPPATIRRIAPATESVSPIPDGAPTL